MNCTGRLALQQGWLRAAGSRFLPLKMTPHHHLPPLNVFSSRFPEKHEADTSFWHDHFLRVVCSILFNGTWQGDSGHIVMVQHLGGFQWMLGWGQNLSLRPRPLQVPFIRDKSLKRTTSSSFSHWCQGILVSGFFIAVASRFCDRVLCPAQVGSVIQGEAATFCSCTFCLRAFPSQGYLAATEKQPHASKIWCLVAAAGTASALAQDCETLLSSQFCGVQHWKALDRIHDLPVASSD